MTRMSEPLDLTAWMRRWGMLPPPGGHPLRRVRRTGLRLPAGLPWNGGPPAPNNPPPPPPDQAETVLLSLRGTGPQGLTGIPPVRDGIIRPY